MTFDWSQYYQLSRQLLGKPEATANDEAKQRCAISRSYYAAFNLARDFRISVKGDNLSNSRNEHHEVIALFRRERDKLSKDIAEHLDELLRMRKSADYYSSVKDLDWKAENALTRTGQVIDLLKKLNR